MNPIETHSLPTLTHVLPPISKFAPSTTRSLLPSQFYFDHSHYPVLAPATLAAFPSTRAIPDRDVFYVAVPKSSIRPLGSTHLCRSLPSGSIRQIGLCFF